MTRFFNSILAITALCTFMTALEKPAAADTHLVPSQHATIQAAIDASTNGDQIQVAPGTYNEAINFNGKAIRLYSSGGPSVTDINGTGYYHVVRCSNNEDANTVLEGFTITGGDADGSYPNNFGGGMYISQSSPLVIRCAFINNSAMYGGGLFTDHSSSVVTSCTFKGNTADFGGGMVNSYGNPIISYCTFMGNSSSFGAMLNMPSSSPTITSCTFSQNSSGGMYNNQSSPSVTNCIFYANTDGGMYNNTSSLTVTNCTFNQNTSNMGGGILNYNSSVTVTNCILWHNTTDEIYNDGSTSTVRFSDVMGGFSGTGNINVDPCFVNPFAGNLRLKPNSLCIDSGDTLAIPGGVLFDRDALPRGIDVPQTSDTGISFLDVTVDMGAYEFQLCRIDGDINCDSKVDFLDLAILANNWLEGL